MLRISQPLSAIVPELRRAVAEVDASLPVSDLEMLDEFFARAGGCAETRWCWSASLAQSRYCSRFVASTPIVAYGVVQTDA